MSMENFGKKFKNNKKENSEKEKLAKDENEDVRGVEGVRDAVARNPNTTEDRTKIKLPEEPGGEIHLDKILSNPVKDEEIERLAKELNTNTEEVSNKIKNAKRISLIEMKAKKGDSISEEEMLFLMKLQPKDTFGYGVDERVLKLREKITAEGLTFPEKVGGDLNLDGLTSTERLTVPKEIDEERSKIEKKKNDSDFGITTFGDTHGFKKK